ncbi:MAG: signal peptidase II [Gammaproteobacteria bacterium]|nr:signal peptidase II [Gammaproteobacteria bacterium]MBA3730988.1 signal peptidase II [Gammaproteobacteria bacterium]
MCLCIIADLGSKAAVRVTLADAPARYYLGGWLRLSHWENAGTMMSFGDSLPRSSRYWLFTVAAGMFAAGLIVFLLTKSGLTATQITAGSLIAGGTLSNVIDRLLHDGRALDFVNIVMTPLHLMLFNLADVAIALGIIMLLYLALRRLFIKLSGGI